MDRAFTSAPRFEYVAKESGRLMSSFAAPQQQQRATGRPRQPWTYSASRSLGQRASSSFGQSAAPRFGYNYTPPMAAFGMNTGQQAGQQMPGSYNGNPIGKAGVTGTKADQANPFLEAASAKYGVPVNFLKAILIRESSGDWARDGARPVNLRGSTILPYVGIFRNAWESWGCETPFDQAIGNQQAQIDCLAKGMAGWYQRAKAANPNYSWVNVAAMHFSGDFDPNNNFCDEQGLCTRQYVDWFLRDWQNFDGAGFDPNASGVGSAGSGSAGYGLATVWGGGGTDGRLPSWGSFNIPSTNGLYGYGAQYGLNGVNHTGIDIPGRIGDPVYTPVAGRVVCACTGSGGGCASFNDYNGQGCGRVEIETANGHRIIFGHSSTATVRVGDVVQAGQQVATFGGMNSDHIHLEYRIPDPSTPSGYRIVDPAQHLGGGGGGAVFGAGAGAGAQSTSMLGQYLRPVTARYSGMSTGNRMGAYVNSGGRYGPSPFALSRR